MRIAVTGASGFVGRSLITDLLARGHSVRALVRYPEASLATLPIETIATGPIESIGDWRSYLNSIDAVVHLAARAHLDDRDMLDAQHIRAVNTDATLALARSAAKRKVGQFIYLSSASVHGDATAKNCAFRIDSPYNPQSNYARSKTEAEQGLKDMSEASGMGITVLRPPLVYGAGARGNFRSLAQLVRKMPALPFLTVRNQRSLLAAENLASAITAVLETRNTSFQAYLVSDGQDISLPELVRLATASLNTSCLLFPAPRWLLVMLAAAAGKRSQMEKLTGSFRIDASAFSEDFGWQPALKAEEAIKKSFRSFAEQTTKA